jgi:hypothetical protein
MGGGVKFISLIISLLFSWQASAQVPMTGAGLAAPAVSGGGCSQATAFIARETAHTNDTLYTTYICGLVTDGVWAKLDLLYIFAGLNSTDALLNMVASTTTTLSATAPTFTAGTGFAGNGASAVITATGYSFTTGTNFTQNAGSIFAWSTEAGVDNGYITGNAGAVDSSVTIQSFNFGSASAATINSSSALAGTTATGLGMFLVSRTTSTELDIYHNGSNSGTTNTNTSSAVTATNATYLASGSLGFFGGGIAAGGAGGGLTSTDASNLYNRTHTLLHAINPTTFP